jgi:hypothetical protein
VPPPARPRCGRRPHRCRITGDEPLRTATPPPHSTWPAWPRNAARLPDHRPHRQ